MCVTPGGRVAILPAVLAGWLGIEALVDEIVDLGVAARRRCGRFARVHVRACPQLDQVLAQTLVRAWAAGAGPSDERLVVDVDSFVGEVFGYAKQGAGKSSWK